MKTAYIFPGQGAQLAGMGRDLAEADPQAAELYARANEIVGYDLAALCFDGPQERLNETDLSQPAIFVTSAALLQAVRAGKVGGEELCEAGADFHAGLSLGEYTALYAGGAVDFEAALKLVQLRGQSMQEAAGQREGTMVSLLGMDQEGVEKLCRAVLGEHPTEPDGAEAVLAGVNFNCPGQIVLSGTVIACQRAAAVAEHYGASRAIPLAVAGGFHTKMMDPAAAKLRAALDATKFCQPQYPVVANVDAARYDSAEEIPDKLMRQLVSPVRWQQSVEYLLQEGVECFVEIGPGRVLTGLVKKISRALKRKVKIVTVNGVS